MPDIVNQLRQAAVLPVVTAHQVADTVKLAETLTNNGLSCIEITCRTDCAIDAIKAIKDSNVDILLGAGTVTDSELLKDLAAIGVDFAVSPGVTPALLQTAVDTDITLIPGISSASEIMLCMDYGFRHLKMFPAVPVNAAQLLKAFHAPFSSVQFCPTGGVNMTNLKSFLQMPNVFCVGGSWMVANKLIANGEWDKVAQLCRDCVLAVAEIRQELE